MRPIDKGDSPQVFTKYEDAQQPLVNRLGAYCSYCERRLPTDVAIEHILPKDDDLPYTHLKTEWTNFLLSCRNCNSAKGVQEHAINDCLLPDRDNTFPYFNYEETGLVDVTVGIDPAIATMANNTIEIVNLNKNEHDNWDDTLVYTALERFGQRTQAWVQAKEARVDYDNREVNVRRICAEAAATSFFSIWMKAFEGVPEVRQRLIETFAHTARDCFDADTNPIMPRPRNTLINSGKA